MKYLCLHGAFSSAKTFKLQLAPFIEEVERTSNNCFVWVDGARLVDPPPGFDDFFGPPPLYRHIEADGTNGMTEIMLRVRDFPKADSPEDTLRKLIDGRSIFSPVAVRLAMGRLFQILDDDPESEGILGYSEGAAVGASLVLEEQRRWEEEGIPRRLKGAILITGFPPFKDVDGEVRAMLADECEDVVVDIPTCHIIGCKDPYLDSALALYNVCDGDTAALFDHGRGHTVPRDPTTIRELATKINELSVRARDFKF